jgi:hypothetical protein
MCKDKTSFRNYEFGVSEANSFFVEAKKMLHLRSILTVSWKNQV